MKSLIYTFLALFIWTMVPVDAIASRDNHQNRQSTSYRESTNYDREDELKFFGLMALAEVKQPLQHRPNRYTQKNHFVAKICVLQPLF